MSKLKQITWLAAILLALVSLASAKKQPIQHAPLPAKVLQGKTIFIQNDSGWADASDKAYTTLKAWGRYQIVDSKEKADLILVLQVIEEAQEGQDSSWVSTYNYKTGAWTNGSVSSPSTNIVRFTQVKVIDSATSEVAWTDRLIWRRKRSATQALIESLRQRVEEQEKSAR
jgi:hypothetical protein